MNSTHKVEVVPVRLEKHPNADKLSIVKAFGYQVCTGTAEWQTRTPDFVEADGTPVWLGAYVPPDSLVPTDRVEFAFLKAEAKDGYARIKAKRLRQVVSFGLLVPAPAGSREGDDVADILGVKHYEPPLEMEKGAKHFAMGGETAPGPNIYTVKYDLDAFRRYHHVFQPGELVVVTEKLDGCLDYQAKVTMADGTSVSIRELVDGNAVGKEVLGVDEDGHVTATRITNVFRHESANSWLRIKGRRKSSGRGSAIFSLSMTPNHQVWTGSGYTAAENLVVGSTIYVLRNELQLTPIQKQVLLGKLLGDGTLNTARHGTADVSFGHREQDYEYLEWTLRALGGIASYTETRISGYGSTMVRGRTTRTAAISQTFSDFLIDGRKTVPWWVADQLTPLSMAFWYMDDGCLQHGEEQECAAVFSVCSFAREECETLIRGLAKFCIEGVYYQHGGYSYIRLNSDEAEKFFLLVAPYVPPAMQRKLPERYRGHTGWLPPTEGMYKPLLVPHVIEEIVSECVLKTRFDIETETHNFFANKILVHNSNARYVFFDGKMHCGSRTEWKKEYPSYDHLTVESLVAKGCDEERAKEIIEHAKSKPVKQNLWWYALERTPSLRDFCEANPGVVVCGEVFGRQGKLKYTNNPDAVFFAAFDLMKDGRWIDPLEAREMAPNIPWAPLLLNEDARIHHYDFDAICAMAEGASLWPGAKCIREGIVVSPLRERYDPEVGRVKLKAVSVDYLAMKDKSH